ncbi:MAG: phage tail sheath family protein [Rhizobiales bacterium]|nr:phage tail sheath family protein [Hyphomicrobiales bacterium]
MAVQTSYPGVYVNEVQSGVRTVAGVSTSVTGIVGRFLRGPVNEPVSCFSFGEFSRRFGGLALNTPAAYAVDDFYANGGSEALVVRLFKAGADDGLARLVLGGLKLVAASPGNWGGKLQAKVTYPNEAAAKAYVYLHPELGLAVDDLFDLAVVDQGTKAREQFRNLTVKDAGSRRVDRVLKAESNLVRVDLKGDLTPDLPGARPAEGAITDFQGGNDGVPLAPAEYKGDKVTRTGIYALLKADIFNLLVIPPDTRDGDIDPTVWEEAARFCSERRAFLIVDPPAKWDANPDNAIQVTVDAASNTPPLSLTNGGNAGLFFPRLQRRDPLRGGQIDYFVPCGAIAGIMARTDANRGVWKAPAGIEATISGADGLTFKMTDDENGKLNPLGVNCLRSFPNVGRVVWGARTMRGSDQLADDYKYIPVRRLALFIEESLFRGTKWVVFSPNDEPLWSQIRLNVGAFMQRLFRQGAFQGASPRQAYFVKCDRETTTQDDVNRGIVNIAVGFAPLLPAEFVVINIQQIREA